MKHTPVTIKFSTKLYQLKDWVILALPEAASKQLPSRGQVSVTAAIKGHEFPVVLEPDGRWGHWIRLTDELQKATGTKAGDTVQVSMTTCDTWPEPSVPKDIADALKSAPEKVREKWQDITPMARWEWVRWINSTGSESTRDIRIEKTISKLNGTHRRPCCFNLAACTEPYVSKSGQLVEVA